MIRRIMSVGYVDGRDEMLYDIIRKIQQTGGKGIHQ